MNSTIEALIFGRGMYWWCRHLLFWVVIYMDEIMYVSLVDLEAIDLWYSAIAFLLDVVIVYLLLYPFFGWVSSSKRYFSFFIAFVLLVTIDIGAVVFVHYVITESLPYPEEWLSSMTSTFTLVSTAIGIKVGKYYYRQLQITQELQSSQSRLELDALKEQINPHFLFNVLNTINVQSMSNPEAVSDTVINLSDLLRYQIYEAGQCEVVSLIKEVNFLQNYLNLEKMRRANLVVTWTEVNQLPNAKIKPFLFLPLIENAIKHSISLEEKNTFINIKWVYKDPQLSLEVSNTIGDNSNNKEGGFGIDNLKKRLNILYAKNYKLHMRSSEGIFYSTLQIKLQ